MINALVCAGCRDYDRPVIVGSGEEFAYRIIAESVKMRGLERDPVEARKTVTFYLVYLSSPVSLDNLVSLSGASRGRRLLNVMDDLRKRKLVREKREVGKGVLFYR